MSKLASAVLGLLALASSGCAFIREVNVRGVVADDHNWYDQTTRTIHVAPDQSLRVHAHEACHAWQGRALPAGDVDLSGWYDTPEGRDFPGTLEQAADVCAYYVLGITLDADYTQYDYLTDIDPRWQAWAERWIRK